MIRGTEIELNGNKYICPPLCLDDVQAYLPRIQEMQAEGGMKIGHFAIVKEVVLAALKRNYPELTATDIGTGLDLGNFKDVMDAVMARSGLVKNSPGEAPGAAAS